MRYVTLLCKHYEWALTMFDVGEEGCVSTAGYMELGLYVRMRFYRIEYRLRSDNQISKERYKSNPVGSALILTPTTASR